MTSEKNINHLQMTPETLKDLKLLHKEARKKGQTTMLFQDKELDVSYAEYLIEFIEGEFERRGVKSMKYPV